jgi:nucleoside 2-deoxyribosyltransferase
MKFYIASRTEQIPNVQKMFKLLLDKGQEVVFDWTQIEQVNRPYSNHFIRTRKMANEEINAIKNADIFIIIGDKAGTGMYVEMGAALASNTKVYAIGEYNDITVFHFHENVIQKNTFDEVLVDLNLV